MKHVILYGASDDLIEIDGDFREEIAEEKADLEIAGLIITVEFEGCWSIKVIQMDEEVPVTAENIKLSIAESGFSMQLDMDIPDADLASLKARVEKANKAAQV